MAVNFSAQLIVLGVLLSIISLVACSSSKQTPVEEGNKTQVLHYANASEPKSIDPHLTAGSPDNNIMINLYEGLTSKDHASLKIQPGVAESWTISGDQLVYTFKIRKDAAWSNGDPVTAEDFVYSWRRALTPTLANEYAYMMFGIKNAEAFYLGEIENFDEVGVKAKDALTLEVHLEHPIPYFLQMLDHHSHYPVHRKTIEAHGKIDDPNSRWTLPENFVGNGAFALSKWELNNVMVLKKNAHYWDAASVRLNEVHFYPIEDKQAEERAFRAGRVHLTNSPQMAIEKIAVYKKENPSVLHIAPNYATYYYEFNTTRPPFNDVRVRKAVAYAIDRETLVKSVTKAGEVPAYSIAPPDPEGYKPQQYFKYDVELAKKLMSDAGFPNGQGFPGFTIMYNTNDNHRKVALAIQQMLKSSLNIDVQLENKEWKVYLNSKRNLEHQVARAAWLADYLDPSNFFELFYSFAGNNDTGWENKSYDTLLKQAARVQESNKRFAYFEQANQILAEEMPITPLYYYVDVNLVSKSVQGWHDNILHHHPLKGVWLSSPSE